MISVTKTIFKQPFHSLIWLFFLTQSIPSLGQEQPLSPYFQYGEKLHYEITYNWGFIWVDAGTVTFSVDSGLVGKRKVAIFKGEGATYPRYDWFYKVRDEYISNANPSSFRPYTFRRNVAEGNTRINNAYVFDHKSNRAFSSIKQKDGSFKRDTIDFPDDTYDVISMIYLSRTFPFDDYEVDTKIPISLVLDNQVYPTYIRYLGKELFEERNIKPTMCYKFKPNLIEGTIFTGGEEMIVWVTADENRIPLMVETPILVGDIKAFFINGINLINDKGYEED